MATVEALRELRAQAEASGRMQKLIVDAGIDERRVRISEAQGAQVAVAIRGILDGLQLTREQQRLASEVVPRQVRRLAGRV